MERENSAPFGQAYLLVVLYITFCLSNVQRRDAVGILCASQRAVAIQVMTQAGQLKSCPGSSALCERRVLLVAICMS